MNERQMSFTGAHKIVLFMLGISFIVVALNWYKPGYIIFFWDQTFPLNPPQNLHSLFSIWHNEYDFGRSDPTAVSLIPYFLFVTVFAFIFQSVSVAQIILFFMIVSSSLIGMYFLLMRILKANHSATTAHAWKHHYAAIVASIMYVFNPYSIFFEWRIVNSTIFLVALLPWLFLILMKNIRNPTWFNVATFGILTFLISPGLSNPAFLPIVAILGIGFTILVWGSKKSYKGLTSLCLVFILVSSFWTIPVFTQVSSIKDAGSYGGVTTALVGNSKDLSISNIFRFIGSAPITETYKGEASYGWSDMYTNVLFTLIPYVNFLIILAGLAFYKSYRQRGVIIFLTLYLLFIFFAKGLNPPFDNIFKAAFDNIGFFKSYRDPFSKFGLGLAISYTVLLALLIRRIFSRIDKRWAINIIALSSITTIAIFSWPMITGNVFRDKGPIRPSSYVKIPEEYTIVANILKEDSTGERVLSLPESTSPLLSSNWNDGFVGFDPIRILSGQPIISTISADPEMEAYRAHLYELLEEPDKAINTYTKLGIGWIIVRQDNNDAFDKTITSNELAIISHNLVQDARIKVRYKSDKISLFKIESSSTNKTAYSYKLLSTNNQSDTPIYLYSAQDINNNNLKAPIMKRLSIDTFNVDVGNQDIKSKYSDRGEIIITVPSSQGSVISSKDINIKERYVGLTFETSKNASSYIAFSNYLDGSFVKGGQAATVNPIIGGNDYGSSDDTITLLYDLTSLSFVPNRINIHVISNDTKAAEFTLKEVFETSSMGLTQLLNKSTSSINLTGNSNKKDIYNIYSPWLLDNTQPYLAMEVKTSKGFNFSVGASEIKDGVYIKGDYLGPVYFSNQKINEEGLYSSDEWSTFYFPAPKMEENYININVFGGRLVNNNEEAVQIRNIRFTSLAGGAEDVLNFLSKDEGSMLAELPQNTTLPYIKMQSSYGEARGIVNAKQKILLGLQERYSTEWKLFIRPIGKKARCINNAKPVIVCQYSDFRQDEDVGLIRVKSPFDDTHIRLNGFANGWVVDPDFIKANYGPEYYYENPDGSIDFNLTIYFKPQSYFYVGLIISGITLVGCVTYLIISFRRKKPLIYRHPELDSEMQGGS